MANPNFTATMSSDEIWRGTDDTRCITDDLDAIEADILELQEGKADEEHTHDNYAPTTHNHSYNDLTDKPTIPAVYQQPPMLFGVEYLTDEKWNGESLYTAIVDCGNFENGKNVDTELSCDFIVRNCGRIGGYCTPFFHYGVDSAWSCWVEVSSYWNHVRITLRGGESVGSVPTQVQVWYTKPLNN